MASTTIIGTDLALKQRQISVQQNREPSPPLTPEHEKDAPLSRPTPLEGQARANTAAAQGKDDPYGFKSRKKTVSTISFATQSITLCYFLVHHTDGLDPRTTLHVLRQRQRWCDLAH